MINEKEIVDRFLRYVSVDTQSDPQSNQTPSSKKQWDLANLLVQELKEIGLEDVSIDQNAYIMATLQSNVDFEVPTIGFVAHIDTSPDMSGQNPKPQIVKKYEGGDIVLNKDLGVVLSPKKFPELERYKGQDIITTDGTTLLGADDKAGVAEIVSAMQYLIEHPEVKHGKIRICFTPDEEIGRGAHKFDVEKFGAKWAYTMDGGHLGELEYENFNAAGAKITIQGESVHPGSAKDKMVNALLIANEIVNALPQKEAPQYTSGYEGFYHLVEIRGGVEAATMELIIRDHNREIFENRKENIKKIVEQINKKYNNAVKVDINDQYYNMKEKVEPVLFIVDIAKKAMQRLNITPVVQAIRGGTDGAQLSFKGLPCPNIFAGGVNFHGKYEYLPIQSMVKAAEVVVEIAKLTADRYSK